ncbi:tRNA (guanosine(46)-N7)-methyltransferase TrmB [Agarilytica rhodophyticola]|uniref:tRNA (guanosine(46)-N7)-methyltransferase TrmB n=1 Tax=Agarilytica rhodophyticola TaxID=1737490 RepID=UPI000B349BBC|nr:tRNA (guanosine(46)-N7)-methyltransferase TrmB [Agarilytica rhodophyticola]
MKPEYKKKDIRSFVIRAGRMTEGQKNAFDKWWPTYGLSLFDGEVNLQETFGRQAPLVVEVGFGMGDSLLEMAKSEPEKNFIGIEVHPPGVGRLIHRAGDEQVTNLRVYMADAKDVLEDCIPDMSVSRFQLFFPDPWHKKKHHKRRIVQTDFVALVARKMRAEGCFHLATDWENYADHMMEIMSQSSEFENMSPDYLFSVKPDYRPDTKFEKRGERLGHGVWDILFKKITG